VINISINVKPLLYFVIPQELFDEGVRVMNIYHHPHSYLLKDKTI